MSRLKAIPRYALKNNIVVKIPSESDLYNRVVFETYEIKNVHIQSVNQYINTGDKQINITATIFVDARNSIYDLEIMNSLTNIVKDQNKKIEIIYNGLSHKLNNIDILPNIDGKSIHHWELSVI